MIQPLYDTFGETEQGRLKRFAETILAVPKSDSVPAEQALSQLDSQKQDLDAKTAAVHRELARRRSAK